MLVLKNIVKDYGSGDSTVRALKGIDVSFRESEFVAILGPSGCGKTTMLNIIGGSTGNPRKRIKTTIGTPTAIIPSVLCSRAIT